MLPGDVIFIVGHIVRIGEYIRDDRKRITNKVAVTSVVAA